MITYLDFTELDALKARLDSYRPLPQSLLHNLQEDLVLRWTYHSNAIEGNTLTLIYPIKNGHIKKRAVGKNLPQSLPDSDSDWQSVTEADCSRFRCIQTPFGAWLHG